MITVAGGRQLVIFAEANSIWQGWKELPRDVWLALKLCSSYWKRKRAFTNKMKEVGFHEEGYHCHFLLLLHSHKDWWMLRVPPQSKYLTALWRWQKWRDADSADLKGGSEQLLSKPSAWEMCKTSGISRAFGPCFTPALCGYCSVGSLLCSGEEKP